MSYIHTQQTQHTEAKYSMSRMNFKTHGKIHGLFNSEANKNNEYSYFIL